jgi:hypothetical protein
MREGLFARYFGLLALRCPGAEYGVIAEPEAEGESPAPALTPVCLCRR